MTAIPPTSTKGLPETQHATKGAANLFPATQVLKKLTSLKKNVKLSEKRCPLNLVRTRTSSPLKPKPLSNLSEIKQGSNEDEDKKNLDPEVHSTKEHCKNNQTSLVDFSSNIQMLPVDDF
jgi:hypothetical protein